MRLTISILLLLFANNFLYSQKTVQDYYLKRTLKQDGVQLNFLVLEEDKRGVLFYSKRKFYHWYKAQHMIVTQGGSSGVLLHGDFESFYSNKQLESQGDFNRGLKNGEWLYWREDGTLICTESWKKGKKVGWEKWYDERGDVSQTMKHKGNYSIRENNDSIIETKSNGSVQIVSIKDSENRVQQIISKKKGKLHGVSKTFENGELILTQKYKKGELVAEKSKVIELEEGDDKEKKWWQIFKKKEKKSDKDKGKEINQEKKWWQIFKKKNADKESKTEDKKKPIDSKAKKDSEKVEKEKKPNTKEKIKSKDEPKSKP